MLPPGHTMNTVSESRSFLTSLTRKMLQKSGVPAEQISRMLLRLLGPEPPRTAKAQLDDFFSACDQVLETARQPTPAPLRTNPRILQALNYMRAHYGRPTLSLSQTAAAVGCCASYLSRRFREHAGCSFREALRRLRLDRARELLADPAVPIKHVAFHCGFSSCSQFDRRFRSEFRETPTAYRRRMSSCAVDAAEGSMALESPKS